jgi:hypothetical protein
MVGRVYGRERDLGDEKDMGFESAHLDQRRRAYDLLAARLGRFHPRH